MLAASGIVASRHFFDLIARMYDFGTLIHLHYLSPSLLYRL
jgi:hypothetical protein